MYLVGEEALGDVGVDEVTKTVKEVRPVGVVDPEPVVPSLLVGRAVALHGDAVRLSRFCGYDAIVKLYAELALTVVLNQNLLTVAVGFASLTRK